MRYYGTNNALETYATPEVIVCWEGSQERSVATGAEGTPRKRGVVLWMILCQTMEWTR